MYPPPFDLETLYRNLFGPKPGGRRAVPQARKQPAAGESAEPESAETAAEETTQPATGKAKVVLKNLAWGVERARFNDKVPIRLEADVPASLARLTRIQIEVLALLPDGARETLDRKEIHLEDGKASGEVTVFYPQARGEDGNLLETCDFIFTASHRESEKASSPKLPVKQPFVTNLRWEKAEAWFGAPVRLLATTCLKDGEEVAVKVASENGLALETKAKAKQGRLEVTWTPCLCGVAAGEDGKYPEKVEFYAEVSRGGEQAQPEKNFFLKVIGEAPSQIFSREYTWGQYGVHAEFDQRLTHGVVAVKVRKHVMKAWMGLMVDMTRAGITGSVEGCPYDRQRWGRMKGKGGVPNEYHDGKRWLPMPKGFVPEGREFSSYGFVKSGSGHCLGDDPSAVWPDQFEDYDFDRFAYVKKRADWKIDTERRWSRKFRIRPKPCCKGSAGGGCGYLLDLEFEMKQVPSWQEHSIMVCNGLFRSNAGCFSLEEPRVAMAAHEVGHLVGMPDEYVDGGIDPTLNGDGATKGIDTTTLMGQSLGGIKKRHYANFATMVDSQIEKKAGRKIGFFPADI